MDTTLGPAEEDYDLVGCTALRILWREFPWQVPDYLPRIWWRRRESNPRPQVLCLRLYMLIRVY